MSVREVYLFGYTPFLRVKAWEAMMSRCRNFFPVIFLMMLQACASSPQLEHRHQSSGLNTQINYDQLTFSDYVVRSREMIKATHTTANLAELNQIIDGNSPFELKPPPSCPSGHGKPHRRGILLTHGLTDSPYFMRYLGSFFQENCFLVMAVLLPGHGTQPGDLLDVSWQEWAKAEEFATNKLAAEVDEVYLGGFSTGGALSVYQSQSDARVRGLFLFSPAFKVSSLAALANLHKIYSWAYPPAKWVDIMPDRDNFKYESFPKNAAAQIYALTRAVNLRLQSHAVNIPVFVAASQDDTSVNASATIEFIAHSLNLSNKLVLYSTDPKKAQTGIPIDKLELVNSVFPEQKILSAAHTAIVLPPEDSHYGAAGNYSNCIHYYPDEMEKYLACNNNPQEDLQGELTKENLKTGTLRRLMYNPNFARLKISMKKFIDSLP
jgi:esterase/lipase